MNRLADHYRASFELGIWVLAALIHFGLWLSLREQWLVPFFNDSAHRFGPGADFFALYQAGYNALRGESVYRFGETVIPYGYPFRYLPVSAYTIGGVFSFVSHTLAYALWLGVCELCLLYNVRQTYLRSGGGVFGASLASVWLVFTPFFLELWVGQFTFFLASLLFWCILALQDGRKDRAFGWWVASVLWKPASLLWLPLWLRDRQCHSGLRAGMVLLFANGLYFLFFPEDWSFFVSTNLDPTPQWHAGNIGLTGLLYHCTADGSSFLVVRALLTFILVGPVLYLTFGRSVLLKAGGTRNQRRQKGVDFWLLAALWTLLYFLIYKDVWEHHLTLILPFLVLSLWHAPSRVVGAITLLLALPSPFAFYDVQGLGFTHDPQAHFTPAISLLHHSWRVAPLLALYAHWLHDAWRVRKAPITQHSWNEHGTPCPIKPSDARGARV
jgi:hypothetical protein